jgi:hypothetical protein
MFYYLEVALRSLYLHKVPCVLLVKTLALVLGADFPPGE